MEKVLLIDPPGKLKGLNSGIAYLTSSLIKKGYPVSVLDFNNDAQASVSSDKVKEADFIGLSVKTSTYKKSIKLIKEIKSANPDAKIICGGAHPTTDAKGFMENNPLVDYCILGEGEAAFPSILEGDLSVKGIVYRKDKEIIFNHGFNITKDLDKLPFPDFSLFSCKPEPYPLVTSRGCPYQCTYCSVGKVSGRMWRSRSPELVVKELKLAKERYGISSFEIIDDNFTLRIDRAKELCSMMIKEKLGLKWTCPNGIRADRIDDKLIELMKKSGCYLINLGIESGVESIFDSIKKGEKLKDVVNAVKLIKKHKIIVNGFFIIGLRGSTYRTDMASLKFSRRLGLDTSYWSLLAPYPNTEIYDELMKDRVNFIKDWKDGFHFGTEVETVFDTGEYPSKDRLKMYYYANLHSNNYGMIATEGSFLVRFWILLKIIMKYDPVRLPYHIFRSFLMFFRFSIMR